MPEEKVSVGDCPECGYVTGDEVRLPSCTCDNCGSALDQVTTAPKEEVKKRMERDG